MIGLLQWARSAVVPIDGRDALLALILKAKKKQELMKISSIADVRLVVSLALGKKPNENFTNPTSKLGLLLLKRVTEKKKIHPNNKSLPPVRMY
ncbi:hypothetical protein T07_5549 [Trichinella nelsoni]|uniref:Uncharacterized protein n=1 Tax=Trichinella nelsoni TaxID=6336 RepID=A0A0V0RTB3_9BILA|nr:hypothetical protein T07_5549 [Trichinella nelsoni]